MLDTAREFDLYGIFMPTLLVSATVSLFAVRIMHGVLLRRGFYHTDLEQQVLDMSLFIIFTGLFLLFLH